MQIQRDIAIVLVGVFRSIGVRMDIGIGAAMQLLRKGVIEPLLDFHQRRGHRHPFALVRRAGTADTIEGFHLSEQAALQPVEAQHGERVGDPHAQFQQLVHIAGRAVTRSHQQIDTVPDCPEIFLQRLRKLADELAVGSPQATADGSQRRLVRQQAGERIARLHGALTPARMRRALNVTEQADKQLRRHEDRIFFACHGLRFQHLRRLAGQTLDRRRRLDTANQHALDERGEQPPQLIDVGLRRPCLQLLGYRAQTAQIELGVLILQPLQQGHLKRGIITLRCRQCGCGLAPGKIRQLGTRALLRGLSHEQINLVEDVGTTRDPKLVNQKLEYERTVGGALAEQIDVIGQLQDRAEYRFKCTFRLLDVPFRQIPQHAARFLGKDSRSEALDHGQRAAYLPQFRKRTLQGNLLLRIFQIAFNELAYAAQATVQFDSDPFQGIGRNLRQICHAAPLSGLSPTRLCRRAPLCPLRRWWRQKHDRPALLVDHLESPSFLPRAMAGRTLVPGG